MLPIYQQYQLSGKNFNEWQTENLFRPDYLRGEAADQTILSALKKYFPSARITHTYASIS